MTSPDRRSATSTTEQSLERQLDALSAQGLPDDRIFV